jgi:hypothetical protein
MASNDLDSASTLAPPSTSHNYRIASIPADGIGAEVVSAAIEVVQKLAEVLKTFTIEFTHIPWGTAYYKEHGRYVDENVLDVLRSYDASLFGSVGAPGKFSCYARIQTLTRSRCTGPYFFMGTIASNPWSSSALRKCSPSPHLSRNTVSSQECKRKVN